MKSLHNRHPGFSLQFLQVLKSFTVVIPNSLSHSQQVAFLVSGSYVQLLQCGIRVHFPPSTFPMKVTDKQITRQVAAIILVGFIMLIQLVPSVFEIC